MQARVACGPERDVGGRILTIVALRAVEFIGFESRRMISA
jgi:hypothetical protein